MSSENEKDQIEEEDVNAITSQLLNKPGNLTKYTSAAEIAQKALTAVIAACVDNAKIIDICKIGDSFILDAVKGLYAKDKTMKKGLAFPTCVSPASILCHLSPLSGEKEDQLKLSVGEVVRIELGAHIDGFAAQVAHTLVVGASKESPVMGLQADVLQCVHVAGEVAVRLMKPGNTSTQIAKAIESVAKDFDCLPVEGMQSNQISQNCLDGEKIIVVNPSDQQKKRN
jgi:curved DNA binding protein